MRQSSSRRTAIGLEDAAKAKPAPKKEELPSYSLKDFFERVPPGQKVAFPTEETELTGSNYQGRAERKLLLPELLLHCDNDACGGLRIFAHRGSAPATTTLDDTFVTYYCQNCRRSFKTYSLRWSVFAAPATIEKFGERPHFGPPTPSKLLRMFGEDKDHYLKGRRCESQSLGIAAFAYYRRVVERHKDALIDEIIRVSTKLRAPQELLDDLAQARKQIQFTKAVEAIKHGLPQALLINGENPLTLLHAALSVGIHSMTDAECLQYATSIRLVLTEFVERAAAAVKEEQDLNDAVSRLMKARTA